MRGICGADLHCCEPDSYGTFMRDLHYDLITDALGNSVRELLGIEAWARNPNIPTDNPQYGGYTFRNYCKALVDYVTNSNFYTFFDLATLYASRSDKSKMIRNQPNSWLTDIYGANGMQRQDYIDLGTDVINTTGCEMIGVMDEAYNCDYMTDWDDPDPQDKMTTTEWRQFLIDCIDAWRTANPDIIIAVQNARMHDFFQFYDYDQTKGCGSAGHTFKVKGEGPLPYDNIIYVSNKPSYGVAYSRSGMNDAMDGTFGYMKSLLDADGRNGKVASTYATAEYGASSSQLASTRYWIDWCEQNGAWYWLYAFTKSERWNVVDRYSDYAVWNTAGQNWADHVTLSKVDINNDYSISGYDLGLFADAYGSSEGEEHWNEDADIIPSGKIDGFDLGVFADYYGEDWSV